MKNLKLMVIILGIVLSIIGVSIFTIQNSQNNAIAYEEQVETAKSDINIQEKRRGDLLYNLADCVQEYNKHEAETLKAIAETRTTNESSENATTVLKSITEAYPQLKSNENYKQFMTELSTTENLISQYRESYNKAIKDYNRYVKKFPTRLFLNLVGYENKNYTYLQYDASPDAPQDLFN